MKFQMVFLRPKGPQPKRSISVQRRFLHPSTRHLL